MIYNHGHCAARHIYLLSGWLHRRCSVLSYKSIRIDADLCRIIIFIMRNELDITRADYGAVITCEVITSEFNTIAILPAM